MYETLRPATIVSYQPSVPERTSLCIRTSNTAPSPIPPCGSASCSFPLCSSCSSAPSCWVYTWWNSRPLAGSCDSSDHELSELHLGACLWRGGSVDGPGAGPTDRATAGQWRVGSSVDRRPLLIGVILSVVVLLFFGLSIVSVVRITSTASTQTPGTPPDQTVSVGLVTRAVVEGPTTAPTATPTVEVQPTATGRTPISTKPALTATARPTTRPPTPTQTPTQSAAILVTPTPTFTPIVITSVVTAAGGNVRSGPSVNNPVIGAVERGDQVVLVGVSGNWYQVRLGNPRTRRSYITGEQGWIARSLIAPPSLPVPEIAP